jgi:hypothetical protein
MALLYELLARHGGGEQSGLPDLSCYVIPKPEKMYQTNTKFTKWSKFSPNVRKIFQKYIKYINIFQSNALKIQPNLRFFV